MIIIIFVISFPGIYGLPFRIQDLEKEITSVVCAVTFRIRDFYKAINLFSNLKDFGN